MGIDVYAKWDGMTPEENEAQKTGWSITAGNVGCLREAFIGGPYATRYFVSEAFEADDNEAEISAKTLRSRLPATIALSTEREREVGLQIEDAIIEEKDLPETTKRIFEVELPAVQSGQRERDLVASYYGKLGPIAKAIFARDLPEYALSYIDFVDLVEQKEAETGMPVVVHASY